MAGNSIVAHAVEWLAGDMFVAGSGNWSNGGNWTSGTPAAGNDVLIVPSDGASHTVTYDNASSVALGNVTLDETGGAALSFNQSQYTLSAVNETVGVIGSANYYLSGGTNTVSGTLTLGAQTGSVGNYYLSGTGALIVGTLITNGNPSSFSWTGGSLTLTGQPLGFFNYGPPALFSPLGLGLSLYSGMNLTVENNIEWLGDAGASVTQYAGSSNSAQGLEVGGSDVIQGTTSNVVLYTLNGGTLTCGFEGETIGYAYGPYGGPAFFNQTGGINNANSLYVDFNAAGTYSMFGGQLNSNATVNNGAINQYGGTSSLGPLSGTGSTTIGGNEVPASMTVAGLNQSAVTISSMGTLKITGGSDNAVNTLMIDGGQLDITNTRLFIDYGSGPDPIASIAAWIASGSDGGAWNGTGIMSTNAQTNGGSYGIGYADSADPGNPANLSSGTIEIMYTLLGDANLDGKVNGTDFDLMATNFNQAVTNGWDEGDFNYDGKVNGNDFVLLADNFNQFVSQSGVSAADLAALDNFAIANGISLANIPEPTTFVLSAGFLSAVVACRRRAVSKGKM